MERPVPLRSHSAIALLGALLVGLLLWGSPAAARDDEGEARGVITVDVMGSTVTVGGVLMVVDAETRLKLDDAEVTLDALSTYVAGNPGTEAEAEYVIDGDQNIAQKVEVEGAGGGDDDEDEELKGLLEADVANNTVTVAGVVLAVDANTDIEVNDEHGTLEDLATYLAANPGTRGEAKYATVNGQRIATKVESKGDSGDDGDEDDEDEQEIFGELTADVPSGTVMVGTVPFQVSPGTEIKLNRRNVTLAQLAGYLRLNPGTRGKVEYRVLEGINVAREIKVFDATAPAPTNEIETTGVVTGVDVAGGIIHFRTTGGQALDLVVDAATEIDVDAARTAFADLPGVLPVGVEVDGRVHYNPDTLLLREIDLTVPVLLETGVVQTVNPRTLQVTYRVPNTGAAAPSAPGARPAPFRSVRVQLLLGSTISRRAKILKLANLRKGQPVRVSTFIGNGRNISPEIVVTR